MKKYKATVKIIFFLLFLLTSVTAWAQNQEAEKLLMEGRRFYVIDENYDEAIKSFKQAIKLSPDYADAYKYLADVYRSKRKYELALSSELEAIRLQPKNIKYQLGLASIYKSMGKNALVLTTYSEAIALNPEDKDIYLERAQFYVELMQYDIALADYNKAIQLHPSNNFAYKYRSELFVTLKEYDRALEDFNKLLEINSKDYMSLFNRAKIYEIKGLIHLAILDAKTGIKSFPNVSYFSYQLADLYRKKGDKTLALQTLNDAINKNPNADSYQQRAFFYEKINEFDLALKDYLKIIDLSPTNYHYRFLGELYTNFKKFDLAVAHYDKMTELFPKETQAFENIGNIKKHLGKYEEAIKYFETAIYMKPEDPYQYFYKIGCLIRLGALQDANKLANKILKDYNSVENFRNLSYYNKYIAVVANDLIPANYPAALVKLNLAVKEFKEFGGEESFFYNAFYTDILTLKGFVLEKLGRNSEAIDVYNQALLINPNQGDVVNALALLKKKPIKVNLADKLPPVIELISPQAARGLQIVKNENHIELVGRAKDASGIKNLKVNGVLIAKIEDDGIFVTSLTLTQGINNVVITATDNNNNVANKTFPITANIAAVAAKKEETVIMPVATEKQPKFYAILIAENEYTDPDIPDLLNPVNDAGGLKTILESNYTFDTENILTLNNKSREEIMQAIVQKSNSLTDNDNLLIFYAGHGIAEKDQFGDIDGYWIPSSAKKGLNASYISSDDINKALKRSKSKHILIIADACFSGAFTRSIGNDASKGIQKQYNVPSRKIMASGNMEPVPDNSKFVFYLKKNLKENTSKYLTAKKLYDSFYEAILNNSDTSPQYAAIKNVGDEGGEFVFIKK